MGVEKSVESGGMGNNSQYGVTAHTFMSMINGTLYLHI